MDRQSWREGEMIAGRTNVHVIRLIVDIAMSVAFIAALGFRLTGGKLHEWLGVMLAVLFIIHSVLNWHWYANIFRGQYSLTRACNALLALSILATMIALSVTGIMSSRHVVSFLQVNGGMEIRQIHSFAAYWGLVLIGVHTGMHWIKVMAAVKKLTGAGTGGWLRRLVMRNAALGFAAFGIWASYDREMGSKLFVGFSFDFWDPANSSVWFYLSNIAIMGLYVFIAHYGLKLTRSSVFTLGRCKREREGICPLLCIGLN